MRPFELTTARIEARNGKFDCTTMAQRIESYRAREPGENVPLLIFPLGQTCQPAECRIPEIDATAFNSHSLRSAITEHGALIVRDFFAPESLEGLTRAADCVIDACDVPLSEQTTVGPYFNPPENLRTIMPNKDRELGNTRTFHRESGSAMCVEAPSVAESLLQLYEAYGLKETIGEYLGEPPCLTVKKWVLRRSKLPVAEAGWHQDGAFMGTDINSINMWLPLGECGGGTGAPAMDVVPRRLNEIASAEGAQFDWSVSDSHVGDSFASVKPLAPVFNAGDAFFFDHFFLHRTQYRTDFSKLRYAVETWFFGETRFPKNQIPLAW